MHTFKKFNTDRYLKITKLILEILGLRQLCKNDL